MNNEILQLLSKILKELNNITSVDINTSFYNKMINKDDIICYIKSTILSDFKKEELDILKKKVFNIKNNYEMAGIIGNRILLPELTNILSALIIIHELHHYVIIKNRNNSSLYTSLYDEFIPINAEFKFLEDFYKDYTTLHNAHKFNNIIELAHKLNGMQLKKIISDFELFNMLSHIYSYLLLTQRTNYQENYILFDMICKSENTLDDEFSKRNILLNESILFKIKNRNN